jgi:hypothetical protein
MNSQPVTPPTDRPRIAMLVDGENCPPVHLATMLAEAAKHGDVTIRRIYGDWTRSNMAHWKQPLQKLAFQPIQQFHHTAGKNGTDCAMIVDAMDLMYAGKVSGFCLGSSDSDFTRLAIRMREQGCFVMGIGSTLTPAVLVAACSQFVFLPESSKKDVAAEGNKDNHGANANSKRPRAQRAARALPAPLPSQTAQQFMAGPQGKPNPVPLLEAIFSQPDIGEKWIDLSVIGGRLRQLDPDFTPRVYGYRQLNLLIRDQTARFEIVKSGFGYRMRVRPGATIPVMPPAGESQDLGESSGEMIPERPVKLERPVIASALSPAGGPDDLVAASQASAEASRVEQPSLFDFQEDYFVEISAAKAHEENGNSRGRSHPK